MAMKPCLNYSEVDKKIDTDGTVFVETATALRHYT